MGANNGDEASRSGRSAARTPRAPATTTETRLRTSTTLIVFERMAQRKADEQGPKHFPRWAVALGGLAVLVSGYIATRGGPETAYREIAEAAGVFSKPDIVSMQPRLSNERRFLLSISNPNLRIIQITGYRAEPTIQVAAQLKVNRAEEDQPQKCEIARTVKLRRPLVIEPRSAEGLEIEPWTNECEFIVRVEGTTGESDQAVWSPNTGG